LAVVDWFGMIHLFDVATGQELPDFAAYGGEPYNVYEVSFSPDGRALAGASSDGRITLLDAATGQVINEMTGFAAPLHSLAYSPDGTQIAAGSEDGALQLWDAASGQVSFTLTGHTASVNSLAFSPDGAWLVSAGSDESVIVWDTASGIPVGLLKGHSGPVWSVAFAPDGAWLASGSEDRAVKLWEVADYISPSPSAMATQLASTAQPPVVISLEGTEWQLEISSTDQGDTRTIHIAFTPLSGKSLLDWIPDASDAYLFLNRVFLVDIKEGIPYFVSPTFDTSADTIPIVTLHFEGVPRGLREFDLFLLEAIIEIVVR
jgi:WD40 repeat protein